MNEVQSNYKLHETTNIEEFKDPCSLSLKHFSSIKKVGQMHINEVRHIT